MAVSDDGARRDCRSRGQACPVLLDMAADLAFGKRAECGPGHDEAVHDRVGAVGLGRVRLIRVRGAEIVADLVRRQDVLARRDAVLLGDAVAERSRVADDAEICDPDRAAVHVLAGPHVREVIRDRVVVRIPVGPELLEHARRGGRLVGVGVRYGSPGVLVAHLERNAEVGLINPGDLVHDVEYCGVGRGRAAAVQDVFIIRFGGDIGRIAPGLEFAGLGGGPLAGRPYPVSQAGAANADRVLHDVRPPVDREFRCGGLGRIIPKRFEVVPFAGSEDHALKQRVVDREPGLGPGHACNGAPVGPAGALGGRAAPPVGSRLFREIAGRPEIGRFKLDVELEAGGHQVEAPAGTDLAGGLDRVQAHRLMLPHEAPDTGARIHVPASACGPKFNAPQYREGPCQQHGWRLQCDPRYPVHAWPRHSLGDTGNLSSSGGHYGRAVLGTVPRHRLPGLYRIGTLGRRAAGRGLYTPLTVSALVFSPRPAQVPGGGTCGRGGPTCTSGRLGGRKGPR